MSRDKLPKKSEKINNIIKTFFNDINKPVIIYISDKNDLVIRINNTFSFEKIKYDKFENNNNNKNIIIKSIEPNGGPIIELGKIYSDNQNNNYQIKNIKNFYRLFLDDTYENYHLIIICDYIKK